MSDHYKRQYTIQLIISVSMLILAMTGGCFLLIIFL